jgi:hypothetical protein
MRDFLLYDIGLERYELLRSGLETILEYELLNGAEPTLSPDS